MNKISVIIPTRNRPALLEKCLLSLSNQAHKSMEIIVVDDGSDTDEAKNIVIGMKKKFSSIKYIRQKHSGPATARNLGIRMSSAPIVAFIDDDCTADRNWLKSMVSAFRNKNTWAVEGATFTRGKIGPFSHYIVNKNGGMFVTCNMAFRKGRLHSVGGFDERYKKANREDSDAAFSIMEHGGGIVFEKKAVVYHTGLRSSFSRELRKKTYYMWDVLLMKKHPALYRKYMKVPMERFTPLYILFWILAWFQVYFLAGLVFASLAELLYRRYSFGIVDFIRFLFLQSIGSFIVVASALYGLVKFSSVK